MSSMARLRRLGREFDSLRTAWEINDEYCYDGFMGMVIEGKQRKGKSSFSSQSLAEAAGEWEYSPVIECVRPNYREVKKWMVHLPKEFLDLVLDVSVGRKERACIWDDAGFWLFALDWYEPFVKAVTRYIQLAGRQFAALILTTPRRTLISSKVLDALPEMYICRIEDDGIDTPTERPRVAKVYERWDYPDGRKGGVYTRWEDEFDAMLPDPFYHWYKPKSDAYMDMGKRILKREVKKIMKKLDKKEEEEQMEDVVKVTGGEARFQEIEELLTQLEDQPAPLTSSS